MENLIIDRQLGLAYTAPAKIYIKEILFIKLKHRMEYFFKFQYPIAVLKRRVIEKYK